MADARGPKGTAGEVDPKPIYEAPFWMAYKFGGWLADEIRLKSAGLHHKKHGWLAGLKDGFFMTFVCRFWVQVISVAQKL